MVCFFFSFCYLLMTLMTDDSTLLQEKPRERRGGESGGSGAVMGTLWFGNDRFLMTELLKRGQIPIEDRRQPDARLFPFLSDVLRWMAGSG